MLMRQPALTALFHPDANYALCVCDLLSALSLLM